MRVIADLELCQGHGMCENEAPEVFRVVESEDGSYAHVEILVTRLDEGLREKVETAVRVCPNRTLSLEAE
jgi:ferredoxin